MRRTRLHVDVRRPSFSGRRLSSLEQFATPRHVCTVTACFLQSPEDLSLQTQFFLTILLCLRSDICHYGHINRSYLLTYCRPCQIRSRASSSFTWKMHERTGRLRQSIFLRIALPHTCWPDFNFFQEAFYSKLLLNQLWKKPRLKHGAILNIPCVMMEQLV